ncbi:MAG: glycosyltransferase, partial [Candidatus Omnitrophica bacterium]|nr:glycosyltransferase [Candidatus Omnitrophota bacterium]
HGFDADEVDVKKTRRVFARRFFLNRCSRVIAVSKCLRRWLIEDVKIEKSKVLYIPNGCDMNEFHPGRENALRKSLGIGAEDVVIGNVGTLCRIKDHNSLIKAFQGVAKRHPHTRLLIVGDGPLKKELEALISAGGISDRVIFTGRIKDTAPYYRVMDIFVLTSLSENMPNALIQAMATGIPVVATDVGDIRDITGPNIGAVIVRPKDVEAVEKGILYFLGCPDEAKRVGDALRRKAEASYDIEKISKEYEALYREAVAEHVGR